MKIGVIGLGLIGGSIAKAISQNTEHTPLGYDINPSVIAAAKKSGAIEGELSLQNPSECDIIILVLYPKDSIEVFGRIAPLLKEGTVVLDCGGTKAEVCDKCEKIAKNHNLVFIGGHPMAGREKIGFEYSDAKTFENASMILTPNERTDKEALEKIKAIFLEMGFGQITIKTPKEHDEIIAYTSQLAHVLSSAYIKSPTAQRHEGLSAGSFKDMTRVAYLNEYMWSELFLENRENLVFEIETLIKNLADYKDAVLKNDREALIRLLKDGREKKEKLL